MLNVSLKGGFGSGNWIYVEAQGAEYSIRASHGITGNLRTVISLKEVT